MISFLIDAVLNRLFSSCTTKFVCGSAAWTFACLFTFVRCRYSIVIRRICCSSYLAFSPIWSDINRYDLWAIRCDLPTLETAAADGDDDDDDDDDDDEGNDESERWVRTEELTLTAVVGASPQLSPWCEWSQLFCDSFLTHMYNITKKQNTVKHRQYTRQSSQFNCKARSSRQNRISQLLLIYYRKTTDLGGDSNGTFPSIHPSIHPSIISLLKSWQNATVYQCTLWE